MQNIGNSLRDIRKALALSQKQMADGIMSQSNYSKVENGTIEISFTKMLEILDRLDMSLEEFVYINNQYSNKPVKKRNYLNKLKYNDKQLLSKYIAELNSIQKPTTKEKELLSVFEALLFIAEDNDYEKAKEKVAPIWKRLEKYDNWYLYDIQLINNILFIFPPDTALSISELALSKLDKYSGLRGVANLSINIQLNLSLHLINEYYYKADHDTIDELIYTCLEKNYLMYLAVCYVRKGLLHELLDKTDYSKWYDEGYNLLDATQNENLRKELEKEVKHYLKKVKR